MELTGSSAEGLFYIYLQPRNPKGDRNVVEKTCVMENCFMLLGEGNDWIGIRIPSLKGEVAELNLNAELENELSKTREFYWGEDNVVIRELGQEMNIDVNRGGVWGIEIIILKKHDNITFRSFERATRTPKGMIIVFAVALAVVVFWALMMVVK